MVWFGLSSSSSSRHRDNSPSRYSSYSRSSSHRGGSYYKRRPRDGYIDRLLHKLKQLFRDLYYYARRHPYKVFFMVIMPLISGGVLHKIARQFNIPLPDILKGSAAAHAHRHADEFGGYYGSRGYGSEHGMGGGGGLMDNMANLGNLVQVAKAFM